MLLKLLAPEDISGTLADTDLDFYKIELMPDFYIYLICSDKKPETLDRIRDQFAQRQLGLGSIVTDVSALQSSYQEALHQLNSGTSETNDYPYQIMSALKNSIREEEWLKGGLILDELGTLLHQMDDFTLTGVIWDIVWILKLNASETLHFINTTDGTLAEKASILIRQAKEQFNTAPINDPPVYNKKRSIEEIISYVDEHFLEDNFSVKYMASYFDTSVSNISHFFKKNTGLTISQYVDRIKMEKAKYLLRETNNRISDIAQTLRYANSTVFIEAFKKNENMTPGNYRDSFRSASHNDHTN